MALSIIIIPLLVILILLLLAPITIYINTIKDQYHVEFLKILRVSLLRDAKAILKIKLKLLFIHFDFYPLKKTELKKL